MTAIPPDRRTHAWRVDLADEALRGIITAPRYVQGQVAIGGLPVAPVRREPSAESPLETEALYGERLRVFDKQAGWAWVQLERDGYVGYVPREAVALPVIAATHRVQALATFVYPRADIKSPPTMVLPLGALVRVESSQRQFAVIAGGGHIVSRHLSEIGRHALDFVDVAERFIGSPYLWGGRTRNGLDCSGLVQVALQAAGFQAPRDSDLQEAELGEKILVPESLDGLERGDLVFWPGHVGIMVDSVMVLHANAHHMVVAVEPLTVAAERSARNGLPISSIKRLPGLSAGAASSQSRLQLVERS